MNAGLLLQHFDRLADAPDAIPRLRQFILDLAVRGKLVPQDPNDEPASEVLKRISAARLTKGESESLAEVVDDETPFALPSTWIWSRLGEIFIYDAGVKREPSELDSTKWLLELEDIEKDTSILLARYKVSDRESKSTKSEFQPGDILYGKLRPYLNKVVVADQSGYSTTEIVALRPWVSLDSRYCAMALRRPDFVEYVERIGRGTKMPRLRTPDALNALFPLPPLAEQQRIVAKVDELMALCDRLEVAQGERERRRDRLAAAALQRLNTPADDAGAFRNHARFTFTHLPRLTTRIEHIKQLRQTILNLAVRGKLVPQDPNDEPALVPFISKAEAERVKLIESKKKLHSKPDSDKTASEHSANPHNWRTLRIDELCYMVTSGSRGWGEFYSNDGPKLIRAQNIRFGKMRLDDIARVKPPSNQDFERTRVDMGDLLIVITGAGVTNPAVVDVDLEEAYVSQHVALVKPFSPDISKWLLLCLMAPYGARNQLVEKAYGSGKPGLNLTNIRSLQVPIPPFVEQERIFSKLDELMALCDRLEAQVVAGEAVSRKLLDSVMHHALAA